MRPKMKPRKLTTIPPMSRLLPLMPPRKLTVLRLGSLRLASHAPVSWAIRGAESAKANKAIRARRTEPVRVIESFPPKGIVRFPHDSGLLEGAELGRVYSKRNRMFSIRDRDVGIQCASIQGVHVTRMRLFWAARFLGLFL